MQLHSHLCEIMSILPSMGKNSAETILPFFLPLMEKLTLPLNELESFSNSNNLH